jgi:two-component system, OmpR family, phosphate regulon sensor histidine kinase PhoR
MNFFVFILGFALGVSFYFWKQYQFKRQLAKMLTASSDTADLLPSMSTPSLVRREIAYLDRRCQDLEEQVQTWQSLIDVAPIGYLSIDEENCLLWCNQQARQLLKIDRWQPGQVRLLLELVRCYELDCLIEETRSSQQSRLQEWTYYPTDYVAPGTMPSEQNQKPFSSKAIALKAYSYPLSQGKIAVFLENRQPFVDISRSRDRAFSDLTHELRTPLTSISLLAEALQKRLSPPESRWVERMLKEINRLMTLVQEWLDLSQLQEAPAQHLVYESVKLHDLIFSAWQTLAPLAQQKEVMLDYHGAQDLSLQADRSRLLQVFLNLFDNAIKHSPAKAAISVEVEAIAPRNEIQIAIVDSGSGFSQSDLPFVFNRLYRGDPSRARYPTNNTITNESLPMRHGSGLGLAIVEQIVRAHGGSITAKNHPNTGGAWLQLIFPMQKSKNI